MRWSLGILAAAIVFGGLATADAGCVGCDGGFSAAQADLSGDACFSPPGYARGSAICCGNSRPCCDNAWAGYCEEKAKAQAFWCRVGAQKTHCRPTPKWRTPAAPCAENVGCQPASW